MIGLNRDERDRREAIAKQNNETTPLCVIEARTRGEHESKASRAFNAVQDAHRYGH